MTKTFVKIFVFLALALCPVVLCSAQTRTLTILHANDTHSSLFPFGHEAVTVPPSLRDELKGHGPARPRGEPAGVIRDLGGIARMSTLIKKLRAGRKDVLALHAGDVFVGTFEFNKYLGYPELKIMEGLYDAMALGNHEFDLGFDVLAGVVGGRLGKEGPVSLPLLCANVDLSGTALAALVQKSVIRTVNGIKVGIFGVVNENRQNYSAEVADRLSGDVFAVAGMQAGSLKAAGCEVVICLSHLGALSDLNGLADNVPNIDIVVGGHSHLLYENAIVRNGKIIVQAGSFGRTLGELTVEVGGGRVGLVGWHAHAVDSRTEDDPTIQGRLNELREGIVRDPRFGPVYTRIVATAVRDIDREWPAGGPFRDTALGNLVTDAMKKAVTSAGFEVDLAIDALGHMAYTIPAGDIVCADVFRAVPYGYDRASGLGYKLVLVRLPGPLLLGGLEYSTASIEHTDGLCIQASGMTYAYDSSKPPAQGPGRFSRLDPLSVKVGGELVALNPGKTYNVAMSEQVFGFLKDLVSPMGISLVAVPTGIFVYNAVRDYMSGLKIVDYASEGRVIDTAASASIK